MSRPGLVLGFLLTLSIQSCGGGGGSSAPPAPTVSLSGNAGTYWQDDAVNMRFSASNMDLSTVSYTVAGSLGNNNFVVDSGAGTLTDVVDDYIEAGEYSLTVTATDGQGKTASRAFQFTVDLVATGVLRVCDATYGCYSPGGRDLFIETARDGQMSLSARWLTDSSGYFDSQTYFGEFGFGALACSGRLNIAGESASGSMDCKGWLPSVDESGQINGYNEIARIEVDAGLSTSLGGSLSFYDNIGSLVEIWEDASNEVLEQYEGWPTNSELIGEYAVVSIEYQYQANINAFLPFITQSLSPFDTNFAQSPYVRLVIDENHAIVGGYTSEGTTACNINGSLSTAGLSEYDSVHSSRGYEWQTAYRVLSAEYNAEGCDETVFTTLVELLSDLPSRPFQIDQSSGQVTVSTYKVYANGPYDPVLLVTGHGDGIPFNMTLLKICEVDGSVTGFNYDERYGECSPP